VGVNHWARGFILTPENSAPKNKNNAKIISNLYEKQRKNKLKTKRHMLALSHRLADANSFVTLLA
jgi:hypothetical protein